MSALTTHIESFAAGLEELQQVLPRHYDELSLHKTHGFALKPQYPIYLSNEAQGRLLYVTLRSEGKLAGYFIGFLAPDLHYQDCLSLRTDIFYVVPEYRGRKGGALLFQAVKKEARRRGAHYWGIVHKEHAKEHASQLFVAQGFTPEETFWVQWFV